MKCPACQKPPMKFGQFALANGPVKLRCQECNADLKGDTVVKASYYLTLLIAMLFSIQLLGFQQQGQLSWLEMVSGIILFVTVTLILKGALTWYFGSYIRDWDAK